MATMREIMTENTPVCRAQYSSNNGGPWDCVLPENHAGPHRDEDHDTWDITYRDPEPGVSQQPIPVDIRVRPVQDQLTDLTTRVGLLEVAWASGGETLSERLDRVLLAVEPYALKLGEMIVEAGSVTLSTDEYTALLKDREELHTLRNAAQSDVATEKAVERGDMLSVSPDVEAWRKAADKLGALEAAGVDNWEGYSHAMSIYRGDEG